MGVTVVNVTLYASTTVTRAGATVAATTPLANVSATLVATVPYLDTSGKFQYVPEQLSATDVSFRVIGKTLTDTFGQTDFITAKSSALVKNDSISTPDFIIRTLEFIRAFTDTFGFTDRTSFTFARPLADSFGITEFQSLTPGKVLGDTVGNTDSARTALTKVNFETLALAEYFAKSFSRPLSNSFGQSDANVKLLSKPITDAFTFTELLTRSLTRTIQDGFAMNDSADLADGITYQTVKYVTNVTFVNDSSSRAWNANKADSISLGSAGFLSSQNYCDLSYFAEDYVGVSRTFS